MNSYIEKVIGRVREKYPYQPEFCQTVEEVLSSLDPVVERHPEYEKVDLLGRMVEPERMSLSALSGRTIKGLPIRRTDTAASSTEPSGPTRAESVSRRTLRRAS